MPVRNARSAGKQLSLERLESRTLLASGSVAQSCLSLDELEGETYPSSSSSPIVLRHDVAIQADGESDVDEVTSNISVKFWEGDSAGSGILVRVYDRAGVVASATTDSAGLAMPEHPANGAFRATVDFMRDGLHFHGHRDFTGRVSAPVWVQPVHLRPANHPQGGRNSITVTVKEAEGRDTISGAVVTLLDASGAALQSYASNEDGRVAFWYLTDQEYTIRVCHGDGGRCAEDRTTVFSPDTTRDRWTPIVRIGEPEVSKEFVITGRQNQYLGSKPGEVALGNDFGNSEKASELSLLGQAAVYQAGGLTPQQLLGALRDGMASGGPLATNVVAPLFLDWAKPIPGGSYARNVIKERTSLVLRGGQAITAPVLRHDQGSVLSRAVQTTDQFRNFSRQLAAELRRSISAQAIAGRVDLDSIDLTGHLDDRPSFGPAPSAEGILNWWRSPSVLSRIIGGTQGAAVTIENFSVSLPSGGVSANALIRYQAELAIVLADDFGVDNEDMYLADLGFPIDPVGARGLRAQWILQHEKQAAQPFVNEIVVRLPVEGSFRMPDGFDRIRDLTHTFVSSASVEGGMVGLTPMGRVYFVPDGGGDPQLAYGGSQRAIKLVAVNGGVVTLFSGGGVYFSPDGQRVGGGGQTVSGNTGPDAVVDVVPVEGGVVALLKGGQAFLSLDGLNLGGGGQTVSIYGGFQHIEQIVPVDGGVVTRFRSGVAYFSPDGRNLGGGGDTVLAYSGRQSVTQVVAINGGVLTRFSGGAAYFSPNGKHLGGGGGFTISAYAGAQRIEELYVVSSGVITRFSGGGVYLSPDGLNLGGGGRTRPWP